MAANGRAKRVPAAGTVGRGTDDVEQDVFARQEDLFTVASPEKAE